MAERSEQRGPRQHKPRRQTSSRHESRPGKRGSKPSHRRDSGSDRRRQEAPESPWRPGEPEIPAEILELFQSAVLPKELTADLSSLKPGLAENIQQHVFAAYELSDTDLNQAVAHAEWAKKHASRVAPIREALGVLYYQAERYADAVKELKAAQRISGRHDVLPLIADCERGLGHPEKAIQLAAQPVSLPAEERLELRMVAAGARLDLGQPDAAALLLRVDALDSDDPSDGSIRIKYMYADIAEQQGDLDTARQWFHRAAELDDDQITDAAARYAALQDTESK